MAAPYDNRLMPVIQCSRVVQTVSATVTTSSVLILPANPNRVGMTIWNQSANSGYLTFGTTSGSSTPTDIIATFTTKSYFGPVVYTGPVAAIRNAGTGTFVCYEFLL